MEKKFHLRFSGLILVLAGALTAAGQAPASNTVKKTVTKPKVNDTTVAAVKSRLSADSVTLNKYKEHRVFTQFLRLTETAADGTAIVDPTYPMVQKGQGFDVIGVGAGGQLVLKMWIWGLKKNFQDYNSVKETGLSQIIKNTTDSLQAKDRFKQYDIVSKRAALNFKSYPDLSYAPASILVPNDNIRYFSLSKDSVDKLSTEYQRTKNWDINFGILTTPFKIRFNRFAFSSNAGMGTAIYFQKKFAKDWTWGIVTGFSLTSVTLDAASTNVHPEGTATAPASNETPTSPLTTSTTRPAFTPSLHYVIAYKNINFTVGLGCDIIAQPTSVATPTNPEAGWIYNGKPWIGLGFGVSLFGNNSATASGPTPADGQKPKP